MSALSPHSFSFPISSGVLHFCRLTAKETTLSEISEMLTYVVEHMATKDDLPTLRSELKSDLASVKTEVKTDIAALSAQGASIELDLKSIRRQLNDIADKVDNMMEFRKEIDHALERIAAIEKHLGITRKIAA
jgi:chromosome segregation ATPase